MSVYCFTEFLFYTTKTVKVAEFYDNTSMDLLESLVIQVRDCSKNLVQLCHFVKVLFQELRLSTAQLCFD